MPALQLCSSLVCTALLADTVASTNSVKLQIIKKPPVPVLELCTIEPQGMVQQRLAKHQWCYGTARRACLRFCGHCPLGSNSSCELPGHRCTVHLLRPVHTAKLTLTSAVLGAPDPDSRGSRVPCTLAPLKFGKL